MLLRHYFIAFAAAVAFSTATPLSAQTTDSVVRRYPPSSYEGRRFFVGFIQNENYLLQGGLHLQIFIGTVRPTRVGIVPPGSRVANYMTLKKDTVVWLEVPQKDIDLYESFESELIRYKLVEIIADEPVTVYAMSSQFLSTDSYSVLPVTEWGKEYVVLSSPNDNYTNNPDLNPELMAVRQSEFLVMAAQDNTLVVMSPSTGTERGFKRGETTSVTLNRGQCYLVKSGKNLPSGDGDLSGTIITADKPVGVLAGHVRASIPALINKDMGQMYNSKDHLCDMLLPTNKWDSEYVSVPFNVDTPDGDFFRIAAIEANTVVSYTGLGINGQVTLQMPGDTASFSYLYGPIRWKANKKFTIAQYMCTSFSESVDKSNYDPSMVILPPRNRFVSRSLFQILPSSSIKTHYVGLAVEASALRNIKIDGVPVADVNPYLLTQMIPGTNLYWVNLSIGTGNHELKAETGKFSGVIYGVGRDDSYAMTLGISFDRPDEDTLPPVITYSSNCGALTGEATDKAHIEMTGIFSAAVIQNTNFSYAISPLTDTSRYLTFSAKPIDPTKNGIIIFDVRDKAGNGRIVRHTYTGISVLIDKKEISYGAVNWLDSVCQTVVIRNTGTAPVIVSDVVLSGDKRVHFVPDISASLKNRSLAAGDSIVVQICFYPAEDSISLAAVCQIKLPCSFSVDIPLTSRVVAPGLLAQDWDFGDVLIGDTACATVPIKNTGNIPMTIKEILVGQLPYFTFNIAGLTPDTLAPGEIVLVPVCFMPLERLDYQEAGFAVDQTNGRTGFAVKGRGVAPLITAIDIDWGKRRAGTVNDSVFWLVNRGNASAIVEFTAQTGDNAAFATLSSGVKGTEIKKGDSISVVASFLPLSNDIRAFSVSERFSIVNWKQHPPVNVTLSGEGTLPAVTTFDTDFGTVTVNTTKDSATICALAGGNEPLTVDSIYVTAGDAASFIISSGELYKIRTLQPGENLTLPVIFAPKKVGRHEVTLAVVHDAMPNFKRRESLFRLSGNAAPDDTLTAELAVTAPAFIPACARQPLSMTVTNTGNRALVIDSFFVAMPPQTKLISATLPALPYTLPAKQPVSGSFVFEASGNAPFEIVFRATTTVGIILEERRTVVPALNATTIKITLDQLPAAPGQMGKLTLSGAITVTDTTPLLPSMTLAIPSKMAVFTTQGIQCELDQGGVRRLVPITIIQSENVTQIRFTQQIVLTQNTRWSITMPYLLVLSDQLKSPVAVNFRDELSGCFTEADDQAELDVSAVCAQVIRVVKGMSGVYMLLGANPSPAGNTVNIRYISPEPMQVTLEAVNSLGMRISLGNAILHGTSGELTIDVSSLPAGAYRLVGRSAHYGASDLPLLVVP